MMESTTVSVLSLCQLAVDAACEASAKIMEVYESDYLVEYKDDNSPLTIADKAAHQAIVEVLEKSGLPIFSEEGKNIPFEERNQFKEFWLVDPLDGTKEFIKRNGEFTVNIALMNHTVPIAGVIAQPAAGLIYCGIPGEGFYKSEISEKDKLFQNKVSVADVSEQSVRVLASRSHRSKETEGFIDDLKKSSKVDVVSAGSALKFCLLAEGKADVYPRFAPTMEWDTAAGHAILLAVGKNIYSYPGNSVLSYNKPSPVNDWFIAK